MKKIKWQKQMNNNNYYWQPKHQDALKQWLLCASATTSAETRQLIFNTILYQPFFTMSETCLKSFRNQKYINDDCLQESLIHIWLLLPKLSTVKLQYAFSYIWQSVRHNIINMIVKEEQHSNDMIELDAEYNNNNNYDDYKYFNVDKYLLDESTIPDKQFEIYQTRIDIMKELNRKIVEQQVVNKSATFFLIKLKQYLIDNNFDERNFQEYIMKEMNMKISSYRVIASKLKISTILFNKKC